MSADLLRRAANTPEVEPNLAEALHVAAHYAAEDEYIAARASNTVMTGIDPIHSPLVARLIEVARAIVGGEQ